MRISSDLDSTRGPQITKYTDKGSADLPSLRTAAVDESLALEARGLICPS